MIIRDELDMYSPQEPPKRTGTIHGAIGAVVILASIIAVLVAAAFVAGQS